MDVACPLEHLMVIQSLLHGWFLDRISTVAHSAACEGCFNMADVLNDTAAQLKENLTESAQNATTKPQATAEGMALAYGSLLIMAVLPIFFGAFRSVKHHKEQQIFSKEYINLLLTGYFFFLGVLALAHILSPITAKLLPDSIPNTQYHLLFTKLDEKIVATPEDEKKESETNVSVSKKKSEGTTSVSDVSDTEEFINYSFNNKDLICLGVCTIIGLWYLWKKHWIANNLFGLAFAINGVELLNLNNIVTGCILLGGLFFYDIFWVFATDVMVTVAKSFEAPIKLVFPQDLLEKGLDANNFAMLGLGDIVVPGIFIALLLRFDKSLQRRHNAYFNISFLAYIAGLMGTILVMHIFKHAQPALLYLVPACIGAPLLLGLIKGDLKPMFQYEDHPSDENKDKEDKTSKTEIKKDK
uniref:Minor histocompatibility antigen H13 n=1 Tax=Strigamia maritima TaxID=126957 RepID=T1JK34_STRMM